MPFTRKIQVYCVLDRARNVLTRAYLKRRTNQQGAVGSRKSAMSETNNHEHRRVILEAHLVWSDPHFLGMMVLIAPRNGASVVEIACRGSSYTTGLKID